MSWFDRAKVLARLREEAARIGRERPEVERAVLFGSVARGDCVPGSDADVLVILQASDLSGPKAWVDRMARYEFHGVGCGVDVFPYTRTEIEERLAGGDRFIATMLGGVEIYAR